MGVEVRHATQDDVGAIVARGIRRVDQIEADALGRGNDIEGALLAGFGEADCYVMCDKAGPFVIGGITRKPESNTGIPWFVCTNDLEQHRFSFSRLVRQLMAEADTIYEEMEQWMWIENTKARAFAESLGFQFDDRTVNMNGIDFVRFHRTRPGRA